MIDSIPPEFAIPAAILLLAAWLFIEWRNAVPDPNPNARTALDVLQQTGVYPRGVVASDPVVVTGSGRRSNRYPRSCGGVR